MTWILLWVFMNSDGLTSGSQEFNTEEACIVAQKKMKGAGFLRWGIHDVISCVPKGEK